jgi:hypothetical protein
MIRGLISAAVVVASLATAHAADLEGISMPDIRVMDGTRMRLNGMGLRTYSIFGVHIYVAGLYLERRSGNPDSILHSREKKLLDIRFLSDVDAEKARQAWQDGFASNCQPPACDLDPRDVQRFLEAVPAIHRGDKTAMFFTPRGVEVTFNGRPLGNITDQHFAETLLATFIGPVPPTPLLKRELLGVAE